MKINPPDNFLYLKPGIIRIKFSPPILTMITDGEKQQVSIMDQVRMAIAAGLES
jgi:hypothetical protein